MGLCPGVIDMPLRFTDCPSKEAREQGVFKHSRGNLRGLELPESEAARVNACDGPEVVLKERPLRLLIEVPTGTDKMPLIDGRHIFTLTRQPRPWSVDKGEDVRVLRIGFRVVPDFGGTAHAYCCSTLDACIGDLLDWHTRPSLTQCCARTSSRVGRVSTRRS